MLQGMQFLAVGSCLLTDVQQLLCSTHAGVGASAAHARPAALQGICVRAAAAAGAGRAAGLWPDAREPGVLPGLEVRCAGSREQKAFWLRTKSNVTV
jgi:hypothetical protein